jgi:hypothetical protein
MNDNHMAPEFTTSLFGGIRIAHLFSEMDNPEKLAT